MIISTKMCVYHFTNSNLFSHLCHPSLLPFRYLLSTKYVSQGRGPKRKRKNLNVEVSIGHCPASKSVLLHVWPSYWGIRLNPTLKNNILKKITLSTVLKWSRDYCCFVRSSYERVCVKNMSPLLQYHDHPRYQVPGTRYQVLCSSRTSFSNSSSIE